LGSVWWKLWRAAALPIVGADNVAKLRFDDGGSDILCVPPGLEGKRLTAAARRSQTRHLVRCWQPRRIRWAPNSQAAATTGAISAERTSTGRPIVAGDPLVC